MDDVKFYKLPVFGLKSRERALHFPMTSSESRRRNKSSLARSLETAETANQAGGRNTGKEAGKEKKEEKETFIAALNANRNIPILRVFRRSIAMTTLTFLPPSFPTSEDDYTNMIIDDRLSIDRRAVRSTRFIALILSAAMTMI